MRNQQKEKPLFLEKNFMTFKKIFLVQECVKQRFEKEYIEKIKNQK